jgi:hypothetical protein
MEIPGLKHDIHDYWLAVLSVRGDYPDIDLDEGLEVWDLIEELYHALGA